MVGVVAFLTVACIIQWLVLFVHRAALWNANERLKQIEANPVINTVQRHDKEINNILHIVRNHDSRLLDVATILSKHGPKPAKKRKAVKK